MTPWIEAMRLRTLPVSIAGVIAGWGCAAAFGKFSAIPALLCLAFAVLAQIASNFANEYYDFRAGLDRAGRSGPRRGVTEGDISPKAMLTATYATLLLACAVGLCLVAFGGWWLIIAGAFIALGVIAYSAGPWPLSHHALGEVAVILFFGIIPVNLTFYVQALAWSPDVMCASIAIGLMGANVLIVNNYRDIDDDRQVGKTTLAVICHRRITAAIYLLLGYAAAAIMTAWWLVLPKWALAIPLIYLITHTILWVALENRDGARLNPLLGLTAIEMLLYATAFAIAAATL